MATPGKVRSKPKQSKKLLVIKGRNASGQIIEAYIPAGVLPKKDPGLAIAESLKKYADIEPSPVRKPE